MKVNQTVFAVAERSKLQEDQMQALSKEGSASFNEYFHSLQQNLLNYPPNEFLSEVDLETNT